jgi:hypothetical protein
LSRPRHDGRADRRGTYRTVAWCLVRRLVPLLRYRPGGDHLRSAAHVLSTVRGPGRHPARVAEAGRLLQCDPGDVHAFYLGARLVAIGEHRLLRRVPSRDELSELMDAWGLVCGLLYGQIPNDPGHLIAAAQRLDRLRIAAVALILERLRLPEQLLLDAAETVHVARSTISRETRRGSRAPRLLRRADQDANDRLAQELLLTPGQEYVVIRIVSQARSQESTAAAYSTADVLLSELTAAVWIVRIEAPCWPPADQQQALSLLCTIHGALQGPPLTRTRAPAIPGPAWTSCWSRHP